MTPWPATAGLIFVGFGVLVAGAWAWLIATMKAAVTWRWIHKPLASQIMLLLRQLNYRPTLPLVAWRSRRPVPWTVLDLIAVIAVYLIASTVVSLLLREMRTTVFTLGSTTAEVPEHVALLIGNLVLSVIVLAVALPLLAYRTQASLNDFGCSQRELANDVKNGVIGFVMLAPPTYAIQGLLTTFWQPSKHPLVEMFKESPNTGLFALLFASAVIVAPLFEEVIFRVILQGYLEKALTAQHRLHDERISPVAVEQQFASGPGDRSGNRVDDNPYASPRLADQAPIDCDARAPDQPELRGWSAWLPIGTTSTIFALLHFEHGPDWVPLLVLAAGMGYLYQRTHSILPSLIVHSLLNATSMWALWVSVKEGVGNVG
jgi:membrane protease YdiL (CAAX protease family)